MAKKYIGGESERRLSFDEANPDKIWNSKTQQWEPLSTEFATKTELKNLIDDIHFIMLHKANIYVRQAQGITIGNNIQGMHIKITAPVAYTTDWSFITTDGQSFVRTDNNFSYFDSTHNETKIVENGVVLISDYAIANPFLIDQITGSFSNPEFFFRYFDIKDLDQRIGLVSSLATADKSSVVNAINSLKGYVDAIVNGSEVTGSPFTSYADFLAGAGSAPDQGKYAYVTFQSDDPAWPTSGNWAKVSVGDTWRLDSSDTAWSPTVDMTNQMNINIFDEVGTDVLKPAGNDTIPNWLQSYRNNIKEIFSKLVPQPLPHSIRQFTIPNGSLVSGNQELTYTRYTVPADGLYLFRFGVQVNNTANINTGLYYLNGVIKFDSIQADGATNTKNISYSKIMLLSKGDTVGLGLQCVGVNTVEAFCNVEVVQLYALSPYMVANKGALVSGGAFQFDMDGNGFTGNYPPVGEDWKVGTDGNGNEVRRTTIAINNPTSWAVGQVDLGKPIPAGMAAVVDYFITLKSSDTASYDASVLCVFKEIRLGKRTNGNLGGYLPANIGGLVANSATLYLTYIKSV